MKPGPWNHALEEGDIGVVEVEDGAVTAVAAGITEAETEVVTAVIIPEGVIGDY